MNNVCPQPGCGAVYNVTPQHVGKRMTCKRCGAQLVVTAAGIQLEAGAAPAAAPAEAPPAVFGADEPRGQRITSVRSGGGVSMGKIMDWIPDIPTWFFGLGAFLVILFMFLPLIDSAKVTRRQAAITEGENEIRRLQNELDKNEKATDADRERVKKAKEKWEKEERPELEENVESARVSLQTAPYWYTWGMMFGFVLLAMSALGYLQNHQPLIRRVVGAIVIVAEVVLIFIRFVGPLKLF